ncbi:MAG TPA: hypothetical protein VML96_04810 [Egibacteraceae bacterium]|nr:hypothetical protein [Egibacteraceae bacterium]
MPRHVYYYTQVDQPYSALAPLLSGPPQQWLPQPVEASDDSWLVALHADGALPRPLSTHTGLVTVAEASMDEASLLRSVSWRSAASDRIVPVLKADLELAPLADGCQLSLMGTYRPPLSVVGGAGDRLHGHRVAEACVRRFVLDVAERLAIATLQA